MFEKLVDVLMKNADVKSPSSRRAYGSAAGTAGILCNFFLFAIKIAAGAAFGGISVIADAFNNLSDALSSAIAAVSFKISEKPADAGHPFGHRRAEYIASLSVSLIILFMGIELMRTSVNKIIHPDEAVFSFVTAAVLCISIFVKLFMSKMYTSVAQKINSTVLKASAADCRNDAVSSATVLVSVIFSCFTSLSLDGAAGAAVSLFIMYSGISLMKETVDLLLGAPPDTRLVKYIEEKVLSYDGILGIHDLMIHSYGPEKVYVSVHAEVPAGEDILVCHDLVDGIERNFLSEGINLVIHMDPVITDDENVLALKEQIGVILNRISGKLSFHDFRAVFMQSRTKLIFDVAVPFKFKYTDDELCEIIQDAVHKRLGSDCDCVIAFDRRL